MRAFVTGGHGFVGRWLRAHLEESGDAVTAPTDVDVTDAEALRDAVDRAQPEAVYHLAALTHVGTSWAAPAETLRVNATGTLQVCEAARAVRPVPRVLLVSSAEVYGRVRPDSLPLAEDAPLAPVTPYAASKVAAEYVGVQAHLGWGLPVVRARAFNHTGPGQAPTFVVPALARQVAEAERTGARTLKVGNLSPRRDFTDVRDVVRAYRLLVERAEVGEVYNVCSGADVAIEEVGRRLVALAGADLAFEVDPARVRAVDVPALRGDPAKLRAATGWVPGVSLDDTLAAVLDDQRAALAAAPAEGPGRADGP